MKTNTILEIPWKHSQDWGEDLLARMANGDCAANAAAEIAKELGGDTELVNVLAGLTMAAYAQGYRDGLRAQIPGMEGAA